MSLTRHTPLRSRPKGKGNRGEREIVDMLNQVGWPARRNFASGGQGGADVIGVPDLSIEVKRCESVRIWQWIAQAETAARPTEIAVVAFRRSRSPWYVVTGAEQYFEQQHELQELRAA